MYTHNAGVSTSASRLRRYEGLPLKARFKALASSPYLALLRVEGQVAKREISLGLTMV